MLGLRSRISEGTDTGTCGTFDASGASAMASSEGSWPVSMAMACSIGAALLLHGDELCLSGLQRGFGGCHVAVSRGARLRHCSA